MDDTSPPPATGNSSTSLTDLDMDALVHCASHLNLQDVSNMAMSSKYLQKAAYSDPIWQSLFRQQWSPLVPTGFPHPSTDREAYLSRRSDVLQFKFIDPAVVNFPITEKPHENLCLDKDNIIFSEGSSVYVLNIDDFRHGKDSYDTLRGHTAKITSLRLIPFEETCLYSSKRQKSDNLFVTSSLDHSIRLWWKGRCQRSFRICNVSVSAISDKLLGDRPSKILASGGSDGIVRLWSLDCSGKLSQHDLKAVLYGHDKPAVLMSVAGHKTSLLVSISRNSKVIVWDTATSSANRSSCCVGKSTVPGAPKAMKCHESLIYIAAGSSVVAIDIRTMLQVFKVNHQEEVHSFQMLPEKSLICTGLAQRAMLWDVRRGCDIPKGEAVAELDGHRGNVNLLHMDPYKIVSGGLKDFRVHVWETGNGSQLSSLNCCPLSDYHRGFRCSAMAVNGSRILTACNDGDSSDLCFRDFNNATVPIYSDSSILQSKFWAPKSQRDTEE
ncbi:hypothetical protein AABB24_025293 [Solanum stoloniferum]|uniref:Uncharacterized protein n=1 Tax=Solanum stoloniferum TaxID=62892 RepID=A0ABD2SS71_9SOLN